MQMAGCRFKAALALALLGEEDGEGDPPDPAYEYEDWRRHGSLQSEA